MRELFRDLMALSSVYQWKLQRALSALKGIVYHKSHSRYIDSFVLVCQWKRFGGI